MKTASHSSTERVPVRILNCAGWSYPQ